MKTSSFPEFSKILSMPIGKKLNRKEHIRARFQIPSTLFAGEKFLAINAK